MLAVSTSDGPACGTDHHQGGAEYWQTKDNAEFFQWLGYHGLIRLNRGNAVLKDVST